MKSDIITAHLDDIFGDMGITKLRLDDLAQSVADPQLRDQLKKCQYDIDSAVVDLSGAISISEHVGLRDATPRDAEEREDRHEAMVRRFKTVMAKRKITDDIA